MSLVDEDGIVIEPQVIEASEWQKFVCGLPDKYNLAILGGKGGGKSFCVALLLAQHINAYRDRARILVTRRQLKSLAQFRVELMRLFLGAFGAGGFSYNSNNSMFVFANGATLQLGHCESAAALIDLSTGLQFSMIVIDEAGHAPDAAVVDELQLSLRQPGTPCRLVLVGNPAGAQHATLAERHANRPPWVPYTFAGREWIYCPSVFADNPHLPSDYGSQFEAMRQSDPARAEALLSNRWDTMVGTFLDVFDYSRHVFDANEVPIDVLSSLRLGCDWGTASPAYFGLFARTRMDWRLNDDRLIPRGATLLWDEHGEYDKQNIARGTGRTPYEIAPRLIEMCRRNGVRAKGVMDSSAWSRSLGTREVTVASLFKQAGVSLTPALKGIRSERHDNLRQLIVSGQFLVASRARYWLATTPTLARDPKNVEDCLPTSNDHALDATEYFLAGAKGGHVQVSDAFHPRRRMPLDLNVIHV